MVSNDVIQQEFNIFGDAWKLYKTFYGKCENWETVLESARQISKKYHNDKFCNDLIIDTIYQLERIEKRKATNKP